MCNEENATYLARIETWREEREAALRAPDSWLSLVGLFLLQEGYYRIGSHAESDILLPASAPAELGILQFRHGNAHITVTTTAPVLIDGAPVPHAELVDNQKRYPPTLVTIGSVTFFVHHFGDQYAIRVRDSATPAIEAFAGCEWFDINPAYRVQGHLIRHETPRAIPIKTMVNTDSHYKSVGALAFELHGQSLRLLAVDYGVPHRLSVLLRDATAGKQTYGPGRYLTVDRADDDSVVIDFNKAYNPPCAFSPYATCPLPPRENILPVAIEAGERYTPARTPGGWFVG